LTRIDQFLGYAAARRSAVCAVSGALIGLIAWADWLSPETSMGFFYLLPILLSAAALSSLQILAVAALCGYLREVFDPLQGSLPVVGGRLVEAFNPAAWVPGSFGRLFVSTAGFAMTGFFVAELNQRRRLLAEHLKEREQQIVRRQEAEMETRMLIETSPLAVLRLDHRGRILLANQSARAMLGWENELLQGEDVSPYLPILPRMLSSQHSGDNIRTNVECRGQRRNGEVFLASVWLSTYRTSAGPGLAAVVWDASENLRDREGAGFDSMMATSRVVIGAVCHEIRNLASAAAAAYSGLAAETAPSHHEHYEALGTLIRGLEQIAVSGLRAASHPGAAVVDLGTVLDETRIVIEPSLREAGIAVTWELAAGLPLVQADHHSLLQVFLNLARNSQQALEGRQVRELHISAAVESDLVAVRFRDTGPGVAHPEALFRPFQAGAQSSGLGLYISRAILRSHGGGLRYEREKDGSSFVVELWPVDNAGEE
jgi:two-component system, LuxR family, sensor kinase FixL